MHVQQPYWKSGATNFRTVRRTDMNAMGHPFLLYMDSGILICSYVLFCIFIIDWCIQTPLFLVVLPGFASIHMLSRGWKPYHIVSTWPTKGKSNNKVNNETLSYRINSDSENSYGVSILISNFFAELDKPLQPTNCATHVAIYTYIYNLYEYTCEWYIFMHLTRKKI